MLLILIGPPGIGKGTQARRICQQLGIPHVSTGDLLRAAVQDKTELGKLAADYIDHGRLVPDDVIVDIVVDRLAQPDCQKGCLLDGFPRTIAQASALADFLQQQGRDLDFVIRLDVPPQEIQRRLLQRARIEGRADDTPQTIAHRHEVYHQSTKPLVDYYRDREKLLVIGGMGTPDEVFQRIQSRLGING